jgi:hypothetical protein
MALESGDKTELRIMKTSAPQIKRARLIRLAAFCQSAAEAPERFSISDYSGLRIHSCYIRGGAIYCLLAIFCIFAPFLGFLSENPPLT